MRAALFHKSTRIAPALRSVNPGGRAQINGAAIILLTAESGKTAIPVAADNAVFHRRHRPGRGAVLESELVVFPALPVDRGAGRLKSLAGGVAVTHPQHVSGIVTVNPHSQRFGLAFNGLPRCALRLDIGEFPTGREPVSQLERRAARGRRANGGLLDGKRLLRFDFRVAIGTRDQILREMVPLKREKADRGTNRAARGMASLRAVPSKRTLNSGARGTSNTSVFSRSPAPKITFFAAPPFTGLAGKRLARRIFDANGGFWAISEIYETQRIGNDGLAVLSEGDAIDNFGLRDLLGADSRVKRTDLPPVERV